MQEISASRLGEFKRISAVLITRLAIPIFLIHWFADVLLAKDQKWEMLGIRLLIVPLCLVLNSFIQKSKNVRDAQLLCLGLASGVGALTAWLMHILGEFPSPYFAGINLVAICALCFWPWERKFFLPVAFGVYLPYFAIAPSASASGIGIVEILIIASTVLVAVVIREYNESLRRKELRLRGSLSEEINSRDFVIAEKSKQIQGLADVRAEKEIARALLVHNAEVAHDIRSPLSALEVATSGLKGVPDEKQKLISMALERIKSISKKLLDENSSLERALDSQRGVEDILIPFHLENVVLEKRIENSNYPDLKIDFLAEPSCRNMFVHADALELSRVFSNVINNATEAIEQKGVVRVEIHRQKSKCVIVISDSGPGVPEKVADKIFEKGISEKPDGTGLGLYHAKKYLDSIGGAISISKGVRPKVTIELELIPPPVWFVDRLVVPESQVVVIDDDPTVLALWKNLLPKKTVVGEGEGFSQGSKPLYLVDFDLGNGRKGTEVISKNYSEGRHILMTGGVIEKSVREECQRLQVPILPKSWIPYMPVNS